MFRLLFPDASGAPTPSPDTAASKWYDLAWAQPATKKQTPLPLYNHPSHTHSDHASPKSSPPRVEWKEKLSSPSPDSSAKSPAVEEHYTEYTPRRRPRLEPRYSSSLERGAQQAAPLSPIVEQDYTSPKRSSKAMPTESNGGPIVPPARVREVDVTDVPARAPPGYSSFLSRPVKRTESQSSMWSHVSNDSFPPTIPPLDLKPQFSSNQVSSPQQGRHASDTLEVPSRGGSRASKKRGASTPSLQKESFVTAAETGGNADEVDVGEFGVSTRAPSRQTSRASSLQTSRASTDELHISGSLSELGVIRSLTPSDHRRTASHASSTSFLEKRWARGMEFGGMPSDLPRGRETKSTVNAAYVLFWLGFIAPWCWLIGGWLLPRNGRPSPNGSLGGESRGRLQLRQSNESEEKQSGADRWPFTVGYGYPFVAPSLAKLPTSKLSVSTSGESNVYADSRTRLWQGAGELDSWVFRCRAAAIVGCLVASALCAIIALVLVAKHFGG